MDEGYADWQLNRIKFIINLYGEDYFIGKNVLELGSYKGDISKMIKNLGARMVIGVEGNKNNFSKANIYYPDIKFILYNLEEDTIPELKNIKFDIVIIWGLLYHIKNPLKFMVDHSVYGDTIFLETLITDIDNISINNINENVKLPDQSIIGIGCRPSVKYIEHMFEMLDFKYTRYDDKLLNSRNQPTYNDVLTNSNNIYRKFWILNKK